MSYLSFSAVSKASLIFFSISKRSRPLTCDKNELMKGKWFTSRKILWRRSPALCHIASRLTWRRKTSLSSSSALEEDLDFLAVVVCGAGLLWACSKTKSEVRKETEQTNENWSNATQTYCASWSAWGRLGSWCCSPRQFYGPFLDTHRHAPRSISGPAPVPLEGNTVGIKGQI